MSDELLVFQGARLARRFPLGAGRVLVGRGADADLILEGGGVSRHHVWLVPSREGWRFEDAGSTNGVVLNGRVVPSGSLGSTDYLDVGDHRLYVLRGGARGGRDSGPVEELFLATARIGSSEDPESLLRTMLDAAVDIFRAERGLVQIRDDDGSFRTVLARGLDPEGEEAAASQTVARQAARSGRPIVLANSHQDAAGAAVEAPSIEATAARSILCAPLLEGQEAVGVVYLDGMASERLYGPRDLELLETFALHVASAFTASRGRARAERRAQRLEQLQRRTEQDQGRDPDHLVASSPAMKQVLEQVRAVAARDTTALLLGESGTGKELLARAIHELSPRRAGPFVPVNCMALVAEIAASELFGHEKGAFTGAEASRVGRFELAEGGTLFLDEVGELSPEMQVRLLRVLQERCFERVGGSRAVQVDVRVVAATNRDMPRAIAQGSFREDLWYRLNVVAIRVPPLRERPADIPPLVDHFVAHFRARFGRALEGPGGDLMQRLRSYPWPGNVRELRNVIERAFVLETGEALSEASLPAEFQDAAGGAGAGSAPTGGAFTEARDFHRAKEEFERWFFARALREHGGNMTAAAETAGVPRKTIYRKLKAMGLTLEELLAD